MVDLSHNVSWQYYEGPTLGYFQREEEDVPPPAVGGAPSAAAGGARPSLLARLNRRRPGVRKRYTRLDETDDDDEPGDEDVASGDEGTPSRGPLPLRTNRKQWCRRVLHLVLEAARYFASWVGDDWAALSILGATAALLGFAMDFAINYVQDFRLSWKDDMDSAAMYMAWISFAVVMVCLSVAVTHYISPHAIGSGIPEMKTILNGISLKEYLTLRTGASKAFVCQQERKNEKS